MTKLPKILLNFLAVDYDDYMRRPALFAMAEAAARHEVTVVAVNRPLCPFTTAITKRHRFGELFGRSPLNQLASNLYLFSPSYWLHDHLAGRLPFVQKLNQNALRLAYRSLQTRLEIFEPSPIIWYNYPEQGYVMNLFDHSFCIYELYDLLVDVEGRPLERSLRLEQLQRERVDLLLTTSHKLQDKYSHGYRRSYMFGNGLSRQAFDALSDPGVQPLRSVLDIPAPRIGFAGVIRSRLDSALISALATRRPDWSFVLVGPQKDDSVADALAGFANVHFIGPVEQAAIPSVLKAFNIGFMPYQESEFLSYANPLKFYEMAAAGLPQVSASMAELNLYPDDLVKVVPHTVDDWEDALARLLGQENNVAMELGRSVAARFIWEDMATNLFRRLKDYFDGASEETEATAD